MAKTKYTCTACAAIGDKPEIVEHCTTATESTEQAHTITELKNQPSQIIAAQERVTERAETLTALAEATGRTPEQIAAVLGGA